MHDPFYCGIQLDVAHFFRDLKFKILPRFDLEVWPHPESGHKR